MYSQINQDSFVNNLLNIDNGYFLDIGAGIGGVELRDISFFSNTYYLEKYRNWNGICIDYDKNWIDFAKKNRSCVCVCENLLEKNINKILSENNCPSIVDYLSFDVDDAQEKVFNDLDFNKYSFKVITFEHNAFQFQTSVQNHTKEHKNKVEKLYYYSRQTLYNLGYHLLHADVSLEDYGSVEDWWIHPCIGNIKEIMKNKTKGYYSWML